MTRDEMEWAQLESLRLPLTEGGQWEDPVEVGCKTKNVAHPGSYRPDLPLRGLALETRKTMPKWTLTSADKIACGLSRAPRQGKTTVSPTAPHPEGYRPDLPLGVFSYAQLVKPSKAERSEWAARPLVYASDTAASDPASVVHQEDLPKAVRPKAQSNTQQSVRDALRRAYIAQLGGRVVFDREAGSYIVTLARTGKSRIAPWDDVVRTKYPNAADFQQAAERWQSPSNERTRATH